MADQFIGEIRMVGFDFAPRDWADCAGQLIPIQQNTALFALLGVKYGGNGTTTFALPNLQGRVAVAYGNGPGLTQYPTVGSSFGTASVTLTTQNLPTHAHGRTASSAKADRSNAQGNRLAAPADPLYATGGTAVATANTLATAGGSQPHNNLMPSLVVRYVIAQQGIFPPRT